MWTYDHIGRENKNISNAISHVSGRTSIPSQKIRTGPCSWRIVIPDRSLRTIMVDQVDPRAPRFGQAITATLALGGVTLQEPVLVYVVTLALVGPVVTRWRVDPYRFIWTRSIARILPPPAAVESAVPHRFARVIGAVLTTGASALLVVAAITGIGPFAVGGYALAVVVGLLAGLGATTGFCLGCRLYRQVGLFRDLGLLTSPKRPQA